MPKYQVYLYEEQKQFLLKYIRERRSGDIMLMWFMAVIFIVMFMLIRADILMLGKFIMTELNATCILYMIVSGVAFVRTFIKGFGKTFGYGCDKKCIENDWYTITYGNFVYRDKNPHNKHPYYISDRSYDKYICPRFLDWRNATEDTSFIYIKLDNGRGYAIVDDIYTLTK
ncbi:MAG: hypothetical protein NC177_10850 [Ruminococcus flavefaciens]|nr:hypothetical protein [Ruminococcus flavefaciens]